MQVLISVGGWSYLDVPLEDTFIKATETPEKTEKLADAIAAMVEEYGFDGADMDWEHPRVKKGSHKQNEYLLELLAQKLHAKGKLLTAAVLGGRDAAGNDDLEDQNGYSISDAAMGHTDRALELLDFVHIMSYDGGDGRCILPASLPWHAGITGKIRAAFRLKNSYWASRSMAVREVRAMRICFRLIRRPTSTTPAK